MATAASRYSSVEVSAKGYMFLNEISRLTNVSFSRIGYDGRWHNGRRLPRPDTVCIPDEMGLYGDGWRPVRRRHHPDDLWYRGDHYSGRNYSDGVRFAGRLSVQHLFGVRHTNDDGRKAQVFDQSRGIHICGAQFVFGYRADFHVHSNYYWADARLKKTI